MKEEVKMKISLRAVRISGFCGLLLIGLIASSRADSRQWSYYRSDDFDGRALRLLWHVEGAEATVADGMLHLANAPGASCTVALKGLYQVNEARIYLYWPWAMETRMVAPGNAESAAGGITISFGHDGDRQWQADSTSVLLGQRTPGEQEGWNTRMDVVGLYDRGKLQFRVTVDGREQPMEWSGPPLSGERDIFLRAEGIGNDQQSVRIGVKQRQDEEWYYPCTIK